jgi:hypothetical protein
LLGGLGDSLDQELNVILARVEIQKIESQPGSPLESHRGEPGLSRGDDLCGNPRQQFVSPFPARTGD